MNHEQVETDSPRTRANRINGTIGGYKTAQTHSQEWLDARAKKGGDTLLQRYSIDYYRWINSRRKTRKGWPLGKARAPVTIMQRELTRERNTGVLNEEVVTALQGMLQSARR